MQNIGEQKIIPINISRVIHCFSTENDSHQIMNALMVFGQILYPADYNPGRITKSDKDFAKILDFKDIEFPVKIRIIHET